MNLQSTFLTQWILIILSKVCKPDNFESHNSLKLSFTNIRDLGSNFVECEFFLESNSPYILALCETNLEGSNDSDNFSVRGCLPLIWKESATHMHGLAVYVKEGFSFARDLPLKNSADSYWCFRLALLHAFSYFFRGFNVHHNDWLTYSGGTDRSGELCYNCFIHSVHPPSSPTFCWGWG